MKLPAGACLPGGLSLAIGFFDGVHRGHADVIRRAVQAGRQRGQTPAAMTFDPHPRTVLGPNDHYKTVLTPLADKLELMEQLGMEAAYVIQFDRSFAEVTAERFVRELLLPLEVRTVVVGFDFSFGNRGAGNARTLRADSKEALEVLVAEPVEGDDGAKVSSTRIRDELAAGRCDAVMPMLDRPYAVKGRVVHGQARGRLLGYPTANVALDQPYVIPRVGVYAITADLMDENGRAAHTYGGVLNVGYRPTFEPSMADVRLEAHLFDYNGDLYGKTMRLNFLAYIREERKFPSIDELVAQIGKDAAVARSIWAESSTL